MGRANHLLLCLTVQNKSLSNKTLLGTEYTNCPTVLHMNSPYLLGKLRKDLGKHREQLCSATMSCQRHGQEEEDEVRVPGEHGQQAHQQAAGLAEELGTKRITQPAHTALGVLGFLWHDKNCDETGLELDSNDDCTTL